MKSVVLIVLNNFCSDARVLKEAISLREGGYQVRVVALHEGDLAEYETVQGIVVHRVRLRTRSWSKSLPVQILKYLEFVFRVIKNYREYDIYHCNDLNALPIGVVIKHIFNGRVSVVYDAHEYETERHGVVGVRKLFVRFFERVLIKHADVVLSVSRSICEEYARVYGIDPPKLILNAPNYIGMVQRRNLLREDLGIPAYCKIFLYQGGLSRGRGIEILLEAFVANADSRKVAVFMGSGPLEGHVKAIAGQVNNIYYHDPVSPKVLHEYTVCADYGLLLYENSCMNHYYASPNKLFEYIMAEVPLIVSNLYEIRRIVEGNRIGVVVGENTKDAVLKAIKEVEFLDDENVRMTESRLKKIYNWEQQEMKLLQIYNEL